MPGWRFSGRDSSSLALVGKQHRSQSRKGAAVKKVERIREVLPTPLSEEHLKQKSAAGWKLVAAEWEREVEGDEGESRELKEDVPFGLRVADDCLHLEENPMEIQVLMLMMELIARDRRLSEVAEQLNRQGFRTRSGFKWSQPSVFQLLPRLIEVGPRILSSREWIVRRHQLFNALRAIEP